MDQANEEKEILAAQTGVSQDSEGEGKGPGRKTPPKHGGAGDAPSSKEENEKLARKVMNFLILLFSCSARQNHANQCMDISPKAFMVLFMLRYHPDQDMNMSTLAGELNMPKQQLTKLMDTLEDKGLVLREHDRVNRRQVIARLAKKGKERMEEAISAMISRTAPVFDIYSAEEKNRISDAIDILHGLFPRIKGTKW